jgi:hypothetical protein
MTNEVLCAKGGHCIVAFSPANNHKAVSVMRKEVSEYGKRTVTKEGN